MPVAGGLRTATAGAPEVYQLVQLDDYDLQRLTYLLLADIYNGFGFDADSVPYVSSGTNPVKISAENDYRKAPPV